jgi:hypothetical protein
MNDEEDEEALPDVRPDDEEEQRLYLRRLRARHPAETAGAVDARLLDAVRDGLRLCLAYQIRIPRDVVRLLALNILLTPVQRRSRFLTAVTRCVLADTEKPSRARLDFVYKHVVGRPPPDPEPDFGPWFVEQPPPPPA